MSKIITSSFFTTTNISGFKKAINLIFFPYFWFHRKSGKYLDIIKNKLKRKLFTDGKIVFFYNGRSAFFHGLKILGIGKDDEVIIQAYTCVTVLNSVLQTGAKAVFVDVDETLNLDPFLLEKKITNKTKLIIVQHTFGNPANLKKIIDTCKEKGIFLMEDCAHCLGGKYKNKMLGTFGDISIFSFGRDKIISSVNGGFLLINNKKYFDYGKNIENVLKYPSSKIIFQNIFYKFISYIGYKTYGILSIGKVIMFLSKRLKLIPEIVSEKEKNCDFDKFYYKYPNALAYIINSELDKLEKYNKTRMSIADKYNKIVDKKHKVKTYPGSKNIYLRYVYLTNNKKITYKKFNKNNILLGNWYNQVIAPNTVNLKKIGYKNGTCPVAEDYSSKTVNLPCHNNLNDKDINKICKILKECNK